MNEHEEIAHYLQLVNKRAQFSYVTVRGGVAWIRSGGYQISRFQNNRNLIQRRKDGWFWTDHVQQFVAGSPDDLSTKHNVTNIKTQCLVSTI